ncbi:MAG: hypothetical protein ACLP66_20800 [Polyangia bacterium]
MAIARFDVIVTTAAPVATPKVKFEVTRTHLWRSRNRGGGGWPAVMRHIEGENAVAVVVDQGRVCAGIVGDSGEAGKDAIALSSRVGTQRNAAIVEGREVQITRHGQVVARIVPPERIPDCCLEGSTPPAPAVATPKAVAPKTTTPKVAATKTVAPRATTSKAAIRRATTASAPDALLAARRDLIRKAVERRLAGFAGKRAEWSWLAESGEGPALRRDRIRESR